MRTIRRPIYFILPLFAALAFLSIDLAANENAALLNEDATQWETALEGIELSDEQKTAAKEIFALSASQRKKIIEDSGLSKDMSRRKKFKILRKIKPELMKVTEQLDRELSTILSSEQMEALLKTREKLKKTVRQKLKERKANS